jgi:hypothetical protein
LLIPPLQLTTTHNPNQDNTACVSARSCKNLS